MSVYKEAVINQIQNYTLSNSKINENKKSVTFQIGKGNCCKQSSFIYYNMTSVCVMC